MCVYIYTYMPMKFLIALGSHMPLKIANHCKNMSRMNILCEYRNFVIVILAVNRQYYYVKHF